MVSDSPLGQTGFGRVTEALLPRLQARDWEVVLLGINHTGDPSDLPYPVYPANGMGDPLGRNRIEEVIKRTEPDVVFLHSDLWVLQEWVYRIQTPVKVVGYFPVDAPGYTEQLTGWVNQAHRNIASHPPELSGRMALDLVTYTNWASEECVRGGMGIQPDVIPLGVDTEVFSSHEFRYAKGFAGWKNHWKRKSGVDPSAFIVLCANRNQDRKKIDLTIMGYVRAVKRLTKQYPEGLPSPCVLWLNMAPKEAGGFDTGLIHIRECRKQGISHEVAKMVYTSEGFHNYNCLSRKDLNDLYNIVDVNISTAAAEGWGLVAFESAAAGVPQIVVGLPPLREIWYGCAELLPVSTYTVTGDRSLEWGTTNAHAVASEIVSHYNLKENDKDEWSRYKKNSIAHATQVSYNWDTIADQWHEKLTKMITPVQASEAADSDA